MSAPLRSLRFQGRTTNSLAATSGASGELFWDSTINALRLYNGQIQGGRIMADRAWVLSNTSNFSGSYADLTNKPALFSGNYEDLTNKPALFSGNYEDLTNKPTIPEQVSLAGYATESYVTTALTVKESTITAGTTGQYWRGDKSWQTLNATAVGLANVTNESKTTMFTSPTFTGTTTLQQSTEILNTKTGATGTVVHDFSTGAIWYHTGISANFTANFINVPTTNDRTIAVTLLLVQGATAYIPNAVQIAGSAQTIKWLGGTAPTGTANAVDLVSFILVRTGSAWTVLGSMSRYG